MPEDPPIPDLITYIDVHKLTQHDCLGPETAAANLSQRTLPLNQLLGDSHYGSIDLIERLRAEGIDVLAPAMPLKGYKQGQLGLKEFELDDSGRILSCPEGHAPIWTSVTKAKIEVRFDPEHCVVCLQPSDGPVVHLANAHCGASCAAAPAGLVHHWMAALSWCLSPCATALLPSQSVTVAHVGLATAHRYSAALQRAFSASAPGR